MFDPEELSGLKIAIQAQTENDRRLLDELREDVRALKPHVRVIRPRSTTAVSLVASDGGNNKLVFDPFFLQLVRVVDSYGKQLCLDVVSPSTDTDVVTSRQFNDDGSPATALGRLMLDLGVTSLHELSPPIPPPGTSPDDINPGWVVTYRDLWEWAVLYERICYHSFGTDTLIVRDGLLRSKIFRGDLFAQGMMKKIASAIERIYQVDKRRIYLVGLAKKTKLHARYQLLMALENVLPSGEPRFVPVSREFERKNYKWEEYARGMGDVGQQGELGKFVAGGMYFVRFGKHSGDPVWVADVFEPQIPQAPEIFGYLLADAVNGFPVAHYPRCLQQAHEYAQIVDFDLDILQDTVYDAVRKLLPAGHRGILDAVQLSVDMASRRYD